MERSLRDDVKVAFGTLLGATLGWLTFARGHPDLLVGSFVGFVIAMAGLGVFRYVRLRRKT
jgi:uncharacterized membrane protein YfcA